MRYERTDHAWAAVRVATRHDRLAPNYSAFIQLASTKPLLAR
jgi:transposase